MVTTETGANPEPEEEEPEEERPEDDNRKPFSAEQDQTFWRGGDGSAEPQAQNDEFAKPYADLVTDLLQAENAIVNGLETRGVAVVSTSGALVTLLLGLAGLVTRAQSFHIPRSVLILASLAVVFFLLAGLVALWINRPRKTWRPDPGRLTIEMWDRWNRPYPYDPLKKATATRLALWATAQDLTQKKARALLAALAAQAVAVILLGAAAIIVLA
jgi:hypothetical protein